MFKTYGTLSKNDFADPVIRLYISFALVLSIFATGIIGYLILGNGEWSIVDCAYMTVITLTTVGFNEILDIGSNPNARIFTMFLILFGMGSFLFFVSSLTAFIVEGQLRDFLWRKRMTKNLTKMEDHIIVCGLGTTGLHVAEELQAVGESMVLVDTNEDALMRVLEELNADIPYVVGDASDDDILIKAGIMHAKGVIAACTEDKDNLFIIVSAKTLNSGLRVVAKSITLQAERKLRRAGADKVVSVNYIGGMQLASEMIHPKVATFLDRLLRDKEQVHRIDEVPILKNSPFIGKTFIELDVRKNVNLTVLAIELVKERRHIYNPEPTMKLNSGMSLICLGEMKSIRKLQKMAEPTC